jgi:tetratricopeptide (TPR) repeat protein
MQKMPIKKQRKNGVLESMKKTFFKFAVLLSFLAFSSGSFASPRKVQKGQEDWRSLKKAQDAFADNDFGAAIKAADQAKKIRRQDTEYQTFVLENTLKKSKVRHAGDSFDRVLPVLKELELTEAIDVVKFYTEKYGEEFFDHSYSALMNFVPDYSQYPEADFLLGKVYRLEGEYEIAFQYMKNAYDYSRNLSVPLEKYDILYDLAQISVELNDEENYEKFLLVIASDDPRFKDSGFVSALLRIVRSNDASSVEKFFLLYRAENDVALKSFMDLGKFYMNRGEIEKSLRFASFASVIAVTKIEKVLTHRINNFSFTSFEDLIADCAKFDDIILWGNKNGVWELFCGFAETAHQGGNENFARELLEILSRSEPDDYWKLYAQKKLESYPPQN